MSDDFILGEDDKPHDFAYNTLYGYEMKNRTDSSKAVENYDLYDLINCEVEKVKNKALFTVIYLQKYLFVNLYR
jgi:hypothetical protein